MNTALIVLDCGEQSGKIMRALSKAGFQVLNVGSSEIDLSIQGKQMKRIKQALKKAGFHVIIAEDTEIEGSVLDDMPPCLVVIADDSIEWRRLCLDAADKSRKICLSSSRKEYNESLSY